MKLLTFENWTTAQPVSEVQSVNISSICFELDTCESTYYRLIYNSEETGKSSLLVLGFLNEMVYFAINSVLNKLSLIHPLPRW